jgi:hypothetical protein
MSGTVSPGNVKISDYFIAALSLIAITSYLPFAVAALLSEKLAAYHVTIGLIVSLVYLSMAIGSGLSGVFTGLGLIVGPAVGVALIVSQTSAKVISIQGLLVSTFLAGVIAFFISIPWRGPGESFRAKFLRKLPPAAKVGVRGGIGGFLASTAIRPYEEMASDLSKYHKVIALFVAFVIILLLAEILQRYALSNTHWFSKSISERKRNLVILVLRSVSFVVPVSFFLILYRLNVFQQPPSILPHISIGWPPPVPMFDADGWASGNPFDIVAKIMIFLVIILFVFITDIPGSPFDILESRLADERDVAAKTIVDKSFMVTSLMVIINPLLSLFTSVYYAENHVALSGDSAHDAINKPIPSYLCAGFFLICSGAFLFVDFPVVEMRRWLLVAVSPALFCLGVTLTARALQRDDELESRATMGPAKSYFVPVSLTLILTHTIGFELALPLGICYYYLDRMTLDRATGDNDSVPSDGWLDGVFLASAIIALLLGLIRLGFAE